MATYDNNLRIKEITPGDEDGTWGDSTNDTLDLICDAFGAGTIQLAADTDETFTLPDNAVSGVRSLYMVVTSAGSLTATRTITLGPSSISKVWAVRNSTTGGQSIIVKQGSGGTVTVANGELRIVVADGAGAGAAITDITALLPVVQDATFEVEHAAAGTHKFVSLPVQGSDPTPPTGGFVLYSKDVSGDPEAFLAVDGETPIQLTKNGGTSLNIVLADSVISPQQVQATQLVSSPVITAQSYRTAPVDVPVTAGAATLAWSDSVVYRVAVTADFTLVVTDIPTTQASAITILFANEGNYRMVGVSLNGGTMAARIPSVVNPNLTAGGSPATPTYDLFTLVLVDATTVLFTPAQDLVPFSPS